MEETSQVSIEKINPRTTRRGRVDVEEMIMGKRVRGKKKRNRSPSQTRVLEEPHLPAKKVALEVAGVYNARRGRQRSPAG